MRAFSFALTACVWRRRPCIDLSLAGRINGLDMRGYAMFIQKVMRITIMATLLHCAVANAAHAQQAGTMRYNNVSKKMEFYDGDGWFNFALGVPVGACASEGTMDFDPLLGILGSYRYCNGANWIEILGVTTLALCVKLGEIEVSGNKLQVCNGLFWVNIKGAAA